jgi:hypothetical protein
VRAYNFIANTHNAVTVSPPMHASPAPAGDVGFTPGDVSDSVALTGVVSCSVAVTVVVSFSGKKEK